MVTFVQRSAAFGSGSTVPAHGSAVIGDVQILAVATHATVVPSTPTGGDWAQLSQTNSTHSRLTIFTRILTAGNISGTVSLTWTDYGRVEMRSYRGAGSFTVAGNGTGLVSPSRSVTGMLLRFTASAENNNSSFPPAKTLTADAGLLNASPAAVYNWYDGLVAGDDPTAGGGTAPARTATNTGGGDTYPQWIDINVVPLTEARVANTYVEATTTGAGELRSAITYIEASATGAGELRAALTYIEVIVPLRPPFIGWGVPL